MKSAVLAVASESNFARLDEKWNEAPHLKALESLLAAAAHSVVEGGTASLFVWDYELNDLVAVNRAVARGTTVEAVRHLLRPRPVLTSSQNEGQRYWVESASVLALPIANSGGLQGALLLSLGERPPGECVERLWAIAKLAEPLLAEILLRRKNDRTVDEAVHDLSTPLVSARGFTKLALADHLAKTDTKGQYLLKVAENLERMVKTIDNLRTVGGDQ